MLKAGERRNNLKESKQVSYLAFKYSQISKLDIPVTVKSSRTDIILISR